LILLALQGILHIGKDFAPLKGLVDANGGLRVVAEFTPAALLFGDKGNSSVP